MTSSSQAGDSFSSEVRARSSCHCPRNRFPRPLPSSTNHPKPHYNRQRGSIFPSSQHASSGRGKDCSAGHKHSCHCLRNRTALLLHSILCDRPSFSRAQPFAPASRTQESRNPLWYRTARETHLQGGDGALMPPVRGQCNASDSSELSFQ